MNTAKPIMTITTKHRTVYIMPSKTRTALFFGLLLLAVAVCVCLNAPTSAPDNWISMSYNLLTL